ncbi:MAG: DUF7507 domain-containing protein [Angustibacter sp.]
MAALSIGAIGGLISPAFGYQINTTNNTGATGTNGNALITFPGGTTATVAVSGLTTVSNLNSNFTSRGATAGMFNPSVSTSTPMPALLTSANGCAASGLCSNRGTVTITFSRPVRNPTLHIGGLGGSIGAVPNNSILHALGTITGSSPAGATFGSPAGGAVNMAVTNGGLTFDTADPRPSTNCGANTVAGQTSLSGCGTIPVNGLITSLTMRMDILMAPNTAGTGTAGSTGSGDEFVLGVTVPEDFGDAPASYDSGTAASHVLSDLQLGTTSTAMTGDNPGVANAATSPYSVATGANANGLNGDGGDENGWPGTAPQLTTQLSGSTYTATVPISGASAAGQVCGWIDFDRNGTYDTADRACGAFAAGATSVPLTWSVPLTLKAGVSYVRLRASYNTTQVQSPTGRADSGEIEDHTVAIMPTVRVNKTVTNGSTRTFNLQVNGTTVAAAVGNGGTSGIRTVFHTSAYGAPDITVGQDVGSAVVPLAITEAATSGTAPYTSSYSCINGTGAAVAFGSGTSISTAIPTTGTAQNQNITCTFTNTPQPQLSVTKSIASVTDTDGDGRRSAGDIVSYQFAVTNTSDITVTSLGITDPAATGLSCPTTTLAPGASTTCAGTHTLTQPEVNAGTFTNTATATGSSVTGAVTSPPSSATVTLPVSGGLGLIKNEPVFTDANGSGVTDAGDRVDWSFRVTNDSNVTLTSVAVSDPLVGAVTCPTTTLAPGQSTICTALPYTITQPQGDSGVLTNTADATAQTPGGATLTSPTRSTSTPLVRQPALSLSKSASVTDVNANGRTDLGDRITWTFQVRNTGNVTITSVAVTDPAAGPVTCSPTSLAPGATATCAASTPYTITQADVDAGEVANTATSSGLSSTGATVTSAPASSSVAVQQTSTLSLTKSASVTDVNGNGVTDLGDRIAWSFLLRNTGNTTLDTLSVTDPRAGAVTCPVSTLAPGAQTTCTATTPYVVTQPDVDAGLVSNSATARAQQVTNDAPVTSNTSTTDTPVTQVNGLALVKTGTVTDLDGNGTDVGDPVNYSFQVTNSGTVTISTLTITDPRVGAVSCPTTTLTPGAQTTCTGTSTITQADVDAGVVNNSARARGRNPGGVVVNSNLATNSVPVPQTASLDVTKTSDVNDTDGNGTDRGDTVEWTFTVRNTGTVTLTTIAVNDPLAGAVTCAVTTLAPGASTSCTSDGTYAITQADVDAGQVVNTATASGRSPSGATTTSPSASSTTPVPQATQLSLTKSAATTDVNGSGDTDRNDLITWTFLVRNAGTVTVAGLAISDPLAGTVFCPVATLPPGAQTTCTATPYTVTQADVEAAVVSNTAVANGTRPGGGTVTSNTSQTDTPVTQDPRLVLTKDPAVDDVDGNGTDLGDRITWTFAVRNAGTVTLTALAVNDPLAGAVSCVVTTLAPGESTTCTTTTPYLITQADVDAGQVVNSATVSGRGPAGGLITSSPPTTSTTPVPRSPGLELDKSASVTDVDGDGSTNLGDTIAWSFQLTNTGNVTVGTLAVADPLAGPVTCPVGSLAPGQSTTCTANTPHAITQADVDAGRVRNTATASGRGAGGGSVTSLPDFTTTPVQQLPGLRLTKTATVTDVDSDNITGLGDRIGWSFEVANTGTVTLDTVQVTDPLAGSVTCPVTTLPPGQRTTCTANTSYVITQTDVDAGVVTNSATAGAQDPQGGPVGTDQSTTDTPIAQAPALTLVKEVSGLADLDGNGIEAGDRIDYRFTVTNTGSVTLTSPSVEDPLTGPATACPGPLAPGVSSTCAASYTITQDDVDAGLVANVAVGVAQDPAGGRVVSIRSSTETPLDQTALMALTKSVAAIGDTDGDGRYEVGETITWSFEVANTGTVTLIAPTVNDPKAGAVTCPPGPLVPGDSITCTASAYPITQADVDQGVIANSAVAAATAGGTGAVVVSNTSTTETPTNVPADIDLDKQGTVNDLDGDGEVGVGDTITYTFVVTNPGDRTIRDFSVIDPLISGVSCPTRTLAPGQSTTCTADPRVITQADVDSGQVPNLASAVINDPTDGATSSDEVTLTIAPRPVLSLTKSATVDDADGDGATDLGDRIAWSFLVANTGNVSLDTVQIGDPLAGPVSCPVTTLPPGQTTTCTADAPYVITQADVDAGVVSNTAVASADTPQGADVQSGPSSTTTPVGQQPELSIVKTDAVRDVDGDGSTNAGDEIDYTFEVTNSGNVTMDQVRVLESLGAVTVVCPRSVLAPSESMTCTADPYVIQGYDVEAAQVENTATAAGRTPFNTQVNSQPSTVITPVDQVLGLELTKSATVEDVNGNGVTDLGDRIQWDFEVTNTGTASGLPVEVVDPLAGSVTCQIDPEVGLGPGQTRPCSADQLYTITQDDVDAGVVPNVAVANATTFQGRPFSSGPALAEVPVAQAPVLEMVKSATVDDLDGNGTDLGDRIQWGFLITNTGTVTLTGVTVDDPLAGAATCDTTTLAPTGQASCLADALYTITQADVDDGVVSNTATGTGLDPGGAEVRSDESTTNTPVVQAARLSLTKSAVLDDLDGNGPDLADEIAWSFEVRNTGTVSLVDPAVDDPRAGTVSCAPGTLAPGATTTCTLTAPYVITQVDVDAGVVSNTAVASAQWLNNDAIITSDPSTTDTPIGQRSELGLTKSAVLDDLDGNGADVGDRIRWSFLATNTGTTTLTGLVVDDPLAGPITCTDTTLAPGQSRTCVDPAPYYTVTQADVDLGVVANTAIASATAPGGDQAGSGPASTSTPLVQTAALSLAKTAAVTDVNGNGVTDLGDRIAWSFEVANTGTLTASTLSVADPTAGAVTCPVATLAPGATTTCTADAPYAVTQADVDAGVVANSAVANARRPDGTPFASPPSTTNTPVEQVSALSLTKSATAVDVNTDGLINATDRIAWSFLVRNTGTTTITSLTVADPRAGTVTCPVTNLAPGAQTTCTAAPYAITAVDVETGSVTNTATATGSGPGGATVTSPPSSTTTPVDQGPAMTLTKSAVVTDVNGNGVTDLGDRIAYSFQVRNVGNVSLNTLTINDPRAGAVICAATNLAVGAQTTCTATNPYTITQANVDAGQVQNTAQARARSPLNVVVISTNARVTTPVAQNPELALVKSASVTDLDGNGTDLGDTVDYTFEVTNTGTVTLDDVGIEDSRAPVVTATCPRTRLAPGESMTCTADVPYVITQADVEAAQVQNTATASGSNPVVGDVQSAPSTATTPVVQLPQIELEKFVTVYDLSGDGIRPNLGDIIVWNFQVTNTGTVAARTVAVVDPVAGPVTCTLPPSGLEPGRFVLCTSNAPYPVTQVDVDNGVVSNTAVANATTALGQPFNSGTASTDTPIAQTDGLTVVKAASVTDVDGNGTDLGDQIAWSFVVRNTGTVTISSIAVADPLAGAVVCPVTTLSPGAQTACAATAPYTITQVDVDAGGVSNTATADGTAPGGATVTAPPSTANVEIDRVPVLSLVKSASPIADANGSGRVDQGDTVAYSFEVTNTGNVTMRAVQVDDPLAGPVTCPVTTLAPGESTACTANAPYVLTQADVDAGVVSNTATAVGEDPSQVVVRSVPSSTDTPITRSAGLTVVKSATLNDLDGNGPELGDTIDYAFEVTNTGNVTLDAVQVDDFRLRPITVSCPVSTLAPGASTTCTSTQPYVVDAADVNRGVVQNSAQAAAEDPSGDEVRSGISEADVPIDQRPAISLTKSAAVTDANGNGVTDLGDTITWSFAVTNTGDVDLPGPPAVDDPLAGPVSCPGRGFVRGQVRSCTANTPYTITQADVDAGVVSNTATASTPDGRGGTVTSGPATSDTPVDQARELSLSKTGAVTDLDGNGTDLGDQIAWSFVVRNTGTVTVSSVGITDPVAGAVTCPTAALAPGAQTVCTADTPYVITQADVDAGVRSNTALAFGQESGGGLVSSNTSVSDTPIDQLRGLVLTKTGTPRDVDGDGEIHLGDEIDYAFQVTNTGTTTITDLAIDDPLLGLAVTCPAGPLAPGASVDCAASGPWTVTQQDVNSGQHTNRATATGRAPGGVEVTSEPVLVTTPVDRRSTISMTKDGSLNDLDGNGPELGDTIDYTFVITNTGTVQLSNLEAVDDPLVGAVTCGSYGTYLDPGESFTCTADAPYTITQADVDVAEVRNTAVGRIDDSWVDQLVYSEPATDVQPVDQTPGLALTKSAAVTDVNGNGATDLGDRIAWSFLVRNTGTITVNGVNVADPSAGAVACPVTTLSPGAQTACTATLPYTVTQADVDAGVVANTAIASALEGGGLTSDPATTNTPVAQAGDIVIAKSGVLSDLDGNGPEIGDRVAYSFVVTNTGTVTLTNVTVTDPKVGAVNCPQTTVAPGASMTCTAGASYVVTQADVDAGGVTNTAEANGTRPDGAQVTATGSNTVLVDGTLSITPVKSATVIDVDGDGRTGVGDQIRWRVRVVNTGTTTATMLSVTDPLAGPISCPVTTLLPGAQTTCTADTPYVITQADVDAGVVANTATAGANRGESDERLEVEASADVPTDQDRDLFLTKTASVADVDGDGTTNLGDVISYSFEVTNTGTVTVADVAVDDPVLGAVTCPVTTVAPAASISCTADSTHAITQDDVDAGSFVNSARARGLDPGGADVLSNVASVGTVVDGRSSLSLVKSAALTNTNPLPAADVGDTITWSFEVTNTGTTTLSDIAVQDPRAGSVTCPADDLGPGQTTTCTAAPYTVTQDDVDAGAVSNTALATARTPIGEQAVSGPSSTDTPTTDLAGLEMTKTASVTDLDGNGPEIGDQVAYAFVVTNTGTVTLTSIAVTDPKVGAVSCPRTTLAPGASMTCTADAPYTVTLDDVDLGYVSNSARVDGTRPDDAVVSADGDSLISVDGTLGITPVKTATVVDVDGDGRTGLGDQIRWSVRITNTGTTSATALDVTDPLAGPISCPPGPATTRLLPGQSITCTADDPYLITQVDVDAGVVANTATAGATRGSSDERLEVEASADVPVTQTPGLRVVKSASVTDVDGDGTTNLGDTVDYAFEVANTGTVTLTAIAVRDPSVGAVTCPATTLAPGASVTCTAATPHTITQADVDAGVVANTATAQGLGPAGTAVESDPSTAETPVDQRAGITLAKSAAVADVDGDGQVGLGDEITWTFEVANIGTVTFTRYDVDDPTLVGGTGCPRRTLPPGVTYTCTALEPYVITQVDVDRGRVDNTATVTGRAPDGTNVTSDPASTSTEIGSTPALDLVKDAAVLDDGDGLTGLGDQIRWTFEVTNTGTSTVTAVAVRDPLAGPVSCAATVLAPGDSTTCTAGNLYAITQADVDAGEVANTAVADGLDPTGDPVVSFQASRTVPVTQRSGLALTKTARVDDVDGDARTSVGDLIRYEFVVRNTGTVTVGDVVVDDPRVGGVDCPTAALAPGAATTCAARDPYRVTQTDVDAGLVSNTAGAGGRTPGGDPLTSAPSTAEVAVDQSRQLTLVKRSEPQDRNGDDRITAGDAVAWTFTVTNAGTVTVRGLRIDDPTAGPVTCLTTTLAPGERTTCRTDRVHIITAAEAEAGEIRNTATAVARDQQATQVLSSRARATVEVLGQAVAGPGPSGGPTAGAGDPRGPLQIAFTGPPALGLLLGAGTAALLLGGWLIIATRRRGDQEHAHDG